MAEESFAVTSAAKAESLSCSAMYTLPPGALWSACPVPPPGMWQSTQVVCVAPVAKVLD